MGHIRAAFHAGHFEQVIRVPIVNRFETSPGSLRDEIVQDPAPRWIQMSVLLGRLSYSNQILSTGWSALFDHVARWLLLLLLVLFHIVALHARLLVHLNHNVAVIVKIGLRILLLLHSSHAMR